jgi:hypothetical protein
MDLIISLCIAAIVFVVHLIFALREKTLCYDFVSAIGVIFLSCLVGVAAFMVAIVIFALI